VEIDTIVENLRTKGYSYSDIFKLMQKDDLNSIPIQVLQNRKLGLLQSVTVYLKDKKNLTFHDIAELLKRDDRTIWSTYSKAKGKLK
jgi:predicted double-glycine peptidase|tara:strand:- start:1015 stop:1275 length:261 start_codon:yes stop_codon:yes gene_type:complete